MIFFFLSFFSPQNAKKAKRRRRGRELKVPFPPFCTTARRRRRRTQYIFVFPSPPHDFPSFGMVVIARPPRMQSKTSPRFPLLPTRANTHPPEKTLQNIRPVEKEKENKKLVNPGFIYPPRVISHGRLLVSRVFVWKWRSMALECEGNT